MIGRGPAWSYPSGPPPTSVRSARSTRTTSSSTRSSRCSWSPTAWAATPRARSPRKLAVHEFRNAVEAGREPIDKFAQGRPDRPPAGRPDAARGRRPDRRPGRLPQGPGRAREARHGHHHLRPADRGRPRLHRPRRRQPHLHAARRPGRPADRGPLAGQRADPARQRHQGGLRDLPVQGLQERGHPRGRRLRDGRGRHDRLRDPARRPVPALLGRPARLPERRSASSTCSRATTSRRCPRS